jgi:hypothetical protein
MNTIPSISNNFPPSNWEIIDPPEGIEEPNDPSLNIPTGWNPRFYTNGNVGYWDLGNGLVIYYIYRGGTWIQDPPGAVPANPFWINPHHTNISTHNPSSTTHENMTFPDGTMSLFHQGHWYFLLPTGQIYTIVEWQGNYYILPFNPYPRAPGYNTNPHNIGNNIPFILDRPSWVDIDNLFDNSGQYIPNGIFRNPYYRPHGIKGGNATPTFPPPSNPRPRITWPMMITP